MSDYPAPPVPANHVEPVPRRIRAVPRRPDGGRHDRGPLRVGMARLPAVLHPARRRRRRACWSTRARPRRRRGATSGTTGSASGTSTGPRGHGRLGAAKVQGLDDTVRFEWSALDAWFEEDEQVFVHPRSPYTRVDAMRSTRTVRVESHGVVLAESSSPVLLLRDRAPDPLLPEPDRRRLHPSGARRHRHRLSLQGHDERLLVGARRTSASHPDVAWAYDFPTA